MMQNNTKTNSVQDIDSTSSECVFSNISTATRWILNNTFHFKYQIFFYTKTVFGWCTILFRRVQKNTKNLLIYSLFFTSPFCLCFDPGRNWFLSWFCTVDWAGQVKVLHSQVDTEALVDKWEGECGDWLLHWTLTSSSLTQVPHPEIQSNQYNIMEDQFKYIIYQLYRYVFTVAPVRH